MYSMFSYVISQFVILDWKQLVHVAAIDCAQERNLAACQHYEIEGYPTVKVKLKFISNPVILIMKIQ